MRKKRKTAERKPISRKEASIYLIALTVIVLAVLFLVFLKPEGNLKVGQPAPDFTVTDTDGATVHLYVQGGRIVFLNLMDAKCSFCQRDTKDTLVKLYAKYSGRVIFISIDVQIEGPDTVTVLKNFKTTYGATWQYCLDTDNIKNKYSVDSTPTNCIIDRNSKIFHISIGASTYDTLAAKLDAALG